MDFIELKKQKLNEHSQLRDAMGDIEVILDQLPTVLDLGKQTLIDYQTLHPSIHYDARLDILCHAPEHLFQLMEMLYPGVPLFLNANTVPPFHIDRKGELALDPDYQLIYPVRFVQTKANGQHWAFQWVTCILQRYFMDVRVTLPEIASLFEWDIERNKSEFERFPKGAKILPPGVDPRFHRVAYWPEADLDARKAFLEYESIIVEWSNETDQYQR